ncbi:hypothetical protein SAMN05421594_4713 [Chryseobacterium oleae]|uniref:YD repeat-containing protein n=1 Tax=Chryseobacterium oleae TaxID=491207 RepID=A0A1I5CYP6_CHROL|nr:hypothetical protein [Chryseobacterium oleae]SFN92017.1 hypothetical protein SAMN05421594_4713 [Chryseobacterium oleae]
MNTFNWKIEYIFFFLIFLVTNLYSQQSLGEGTSSPIASPAMASMAAYADSPVNQITGLPNINIPLIDVPMQDENVKSGFSLSYNPMHVENIYYPASDVGAGWTLFGGSVIYKKVVDLLDETYDDINKPNYKKNIFDDYYYYNLPGASGKFQIKRDTINNTFSLINLSPNSLKFEYEKESNNATLKIKNFTITDGKGYQFIFNDFDSETRDYGGLDGGSRYKSAYFLSKITSPKGRILASYIYDKRSKKIPSTEVLLYQYCKLKTIETDLGKVILDYQFDESLAETPNDLYSLQKITLKNSLDQIINTYTFNYIKSGHPYDVKDKKRLLASIIKNNKNEQKIEQTSFIYNQESTLAPSFNDYGNNLCEYYSIIYQDSYYYNNYKFVNVLEKIITPSGGVTSYDYGYHEYFEDHNTSEYKDLLLTNFVNPDLQSVSSQIKPYDTTQSNIYTFTVTGPLGKMVTFRLNFVDIGYHEEMEPSTESPDPNNPIPGSEPFYTNFKIKNSNGEVLNGASCTFGAGETDKTYKGYPGTYTIEITGTGKGYGSYILNEMHVSSPPPYRNVRKTLLMGPRLKSVKSYTGINESTPAKTYMYNYDNEDGTGSSGFVFYDETDTDIANEPYIMYKNVKVSEPENGYIRSTYIIPTDYPKYMNGGTQLYPKWYYPYYNITKGGLISKKEIYNEQNQLLNSQNFTYDFGEYSDNTYQFYIKSSPYTSKPAYVKKVSTDNKDFMKNGGLVVNKRESVINVSNFQPEKTIETTADGDIIEKQFAYPTGTSGYTQLENAHIISNSVQTVEKKNGKVISSSQVKFENNNLLPTSVNSINPNDNSTKTALKYDQYDTKDNIRQYTAVSDESTGKGITTTIIWGYNDTMPIAKIEGASLTDIAGLADEIISKSNLDKDEASETDLINTLDIFRTNTALKKFLITTYTYDPLIGVTTVTPPNGMREIYKYDRNNKLQAIVNVNGNIIKEYKYNMKQP